MLPHGERSAAMTGSDKCGVREQTERRSAIAGGSLLCGVGGNAFYFDESAFGEPTHFDTRARRGIVRENATIDFVDRGEIVEIFDEDRRFDDVIVCQPHGTEHGANVVESPTRLNGNIALDLARLGIHAKLPR